MKRPVTLALVALAVLSMLPPAQAEGRVLEQTVYLHENLHILPERMESIRVGDTLKMRVINAGTSTHDVLFCWDAPDADSACSARAAYVSLEPGEEGNLTLVVDRSGTFEYYCTIPGHKQGGMRGELRVEGEASNETPAPPLAMVLSAAALAFVIARRPRT